MSVVSIAEAWPAPGKPFTVAELDRMPDDGHRYELLDGVLVVSPGRHQRTRWWPSPWRPCSTWRVQQSGRLFPRPPALAPLITELPPTSWRAGRVKSPAP